MATATTKLMTADEFFEFANRPENKDRFYELECGEITEMPPPGEFHGLVCALLVKVFWDYAFRTGKGYVCCNDTGLVVERDPDTVRGPDVMFFAESRQLPELNRKFAVRPPQLVAEVLSPNDQSGKVMRRITQFLKRGVPLVWLVDPEARNIVIYQPGKEPYLREEQEELTGEDVLPDFRCRVADFFTLPGQQSSA